MPVPLLDLKQAYAELADEYDAAYRRVMASGCFLLGPELAAFEREFAAATGAAACVGVANGLEALQLALLARGIGPGDEVIVPANGYIATWLAVSHTGATPVPCEPSAETYNLDPARVAPCLTARTKAILPIHLYGLTADMPALAKLAAGHGLFLLEDAAQAHGATCDGRVSGNLGDAAGFSFYPSKNLGAFADAGAITTSDPALAERVRHLRNYGAKERYHHEYVGMNSRMDELSAAFLRLRLARLPEWNRRRTALAARYQALLQGVGDLILPAVPPGAGPVWHLYVIRTRHRAGLQAHLHAAGIGTQIHYPIPPHLSAAYRGRGGQRGDFPIAEQLAEEVLSLPIGPHHTSEQIETVAAEVRAYFAKA